MKHPNVALVERWFEEVWNQGQTATIDEVLTGGTVFYGLTSNGDATRGPDGFKPFFHRLRAAFPDIRITVDDVVTEGDKVAARWTATMTHTGDALGFPATHRPVQISGMCFSRLEGGKLVEGWNNWDEMGMMRQLGMLPSSID